MLPAKILVVQQPRATHAKACACGMTSDPAGTASRSRLVMVVSSPHNTSVLVGVCAMTLVSLACLLKGEGATMFLG
jgi:hypothetical protein